MVLNDPFSRYSSAASFPVISSTVTDGQGLPPAQYSAEFGVPGGEDVSPQLSWSGAPRGHQKLRGHGVRPGRHHSGRLWHWAVANIPANITEIAEGAGDAQGSGLPEGAFQIPRDSRAAYFIGSAPPAGDGAHRYFITVHALDVADIEVPADGTPSFLGLTMSTHALARGTIVSIGEIADNGEIVDNGGIAA